MIRQIDLEDVTDGKRYGLQDLAKVGCNECKGCSSCCTDMDGSILLDPYDAFWLEKECKRSFSELMGKEVELRVIDGVILPNIRMTTNKNCCSFLNEEGRCSIYDNIPSICRIFLLGRIYENNTFQ